MSMALAYYLISVVGGLSSTFAFIIFLSGLVTMIGLIVRLLLLNEVMEGTRIVWQKALKISLPTLIIISLLTSFIPNKRDMMIIAGLHIGEKGVEKVIEEAGEFYPLLKDVIRSKLLELKMETTPRDEDDNEVKKK